MLKVFLSAYACEPGKGSEPGVGWKWANGLARECQLTVLTRAANRKSIELAIDGTEASDSVRSVNFLYHDLGRWALWLKSRGLLPTFAYYVLWQWSVARRFGDIADQHQIVHHLTFCSLLCPGFWRLKRAGFVLGPVGAPVVPPAYLPLFHEDKAVQTWRGRLMLAHHRLPWLDKLLRGARAIVPANSDTKRLLESRKTYVVKDVLLDTGAPIELMPAEQKCGNLVRFVYAGRLEKRKGLELALQALAKLPPGGSPWEFRVIGDGPDLQRLAGLAKELGLEEKICFAGSMPQSEVWQAMRDCDVFVFCSVRDTSGGVNLEAMAMGLPVVCLAHQGVGDITDESCAMRVCPGSIRETIDGLARALGTIKDDMVLRRRLGEKARIRALSSFSWEEKFSRMVAIYEEAVAERP